MTVFVVLIMLLYIPEVKRETGDVLLELEGDPHGGDGGLLNEGLPCNTCGQNVLLQLVQVY